MTGEERARRRARRYTGGLIGIGVMGAVVGFVAATIELNPDRLTFSPATAIGFSAAVLAAFAAMVLFSRRIMDEREWSQNVQAMAAGGVLALAAYVPWLLLSKAAMLPAPTAEGMFVINAVGGAFAYIAMRLRR
ncbi:MAG: hypothetical protein ACREB5_00870 [Sphingomonadaceae bacterium]